MADKYTDMNGNMIKLYDNKDGTFSFNKSFDDDPLPVQLSGSNVEQTKGENIAVKSALVAGESPSGKQVPVSVDEDGKVQMGGITVTATTVGIDQTTPGTTNKVVAQLSGSNMEVYGTSLDDRPDATTVPIGATFTIVDASQEFRTWMSNGTDWGEEI